MAKLSFRDKLGYGPAAYGDAACYSLVCTFLLFFLTTVADIPPAAAGTIIAFGTIIDAVLNTIMGYLTDNVKTRWGRRVPFMVVFGTFVFVTTTFLFTSISSTYTIKIIYYAVMIALFWLSYTGFFVPYLALGAEFTQDYQERTTLRSYAALFNMLGSMTAMTAPAAIVGMLTDMGFTTERAWSLTAGAIGLIAAATVLVTAAVARKFDKPNSDKVIEMPDISIVGLFRQYLQVLKLKPIRWLLLTSLFFLISYGIFLSDMLYFFTYNLGLSSGHISIMLFIRCLVGVLIIPFVSKVCALTDKRSALIIFQLVCAVLIAASKITGIGNDFRLYLFMILIGTATVTYWQVMPAMIYDVCEYDQLETGMKRQGTIVSIQGLVGAISSGVGAQILGFILQFAGFNTDAASQSAHTMEWIENCTTFIPAIFLFLSCVTLWKYPITKSVYEDICKKLEQKQ